MGVVVDVVDDDDLTRVCWMDGGRRCVCVCMCVVEKSAACC